MTVERLKEILAEIPDDYEIMDLDGDNERRVHCVLSYDADKEVYFSYINPDYIYRKDATIYREEAD